MWPTRLVSYKRTIDRGDALGPRRVNARVMSVCDCLGVDPHCTRARRRVGRARITQGLAGSVLGSCTSYEDELLPGFVSYIYLTSPPVMIRRAGETLRPTRIGTAHEIVKNRRISLQVSVQSATCHQSDIDYRHIPTSRFEHDRPPAESYPATTPADWAEPVARQARTRPPQPPPSTAARSTMRPRPHVPRATWRRR